MLELSIIKTVCIEIDRFALLVIRELGHFKNLGLEKLTGKFDILGLEVDVGFALRMIADTWASRNTRATVSNVVIEAELEVELQDGIRFNFALELEAVRALQPGLDLAERGGFHPVVLMVVLELATIGGFGEPGFNIGVLAIFFLFGLPGEIVLVFLGIFLAGFALVIDPRLDAGGER